MKLGTLGAWAGFAVQVIAAGAAMLWPNDLWIGGGLFIAGSLMLVAAIGWWATHREKAAPAPERIRVIPTLPMVAPVAPPEPDQEINLHEAYGVIRSRLGITSIDSDKEVERSSSIFDELRQKARDGKVTIRGRQQPFGSIAGFYKPREAIPAEHWSKMDFDVTRLVFGDSDTIIREAATVPDWRDDPKNPKAFIDLTVFKSELLKAWPQIEKTGLRMIPATQLLKEAAKRNWNVGPNGLDVLRLQVGLREAALHGDVKIYGRKNIYTQSLTRNEPRELIPQTFWSNAWLQIVTAIPDGDGDNYSTQAYVPVDKAAYVDIHFGLETLGWLRGDAGQFRNVKVK